MKKHLLLIAAAAVFAFNIYQSILFFVPPLFLAGLAVSLGLLLGAIEAPKKQKGNWYDSVHIMD